MMINYNFDYYNKIERNEKAIRTAKKLSNRVRSFMIMLDRDTTIKDATKKKVRAIIAKELNNPIKE